jgi:RNA-splicing ligase RtcB
MSHGSTDPWAGEKMSRSDAQRKYSNLIQYQLRPMLNNRNMSDENRVQVLKRVVREAHRTRYESGVVAQSGSREEIVDLMKHMVHPEYPIGEELRDWIKRTFRAYGANLETDE